MPFFTDIDQFKTYVGGNANVSLQMESVAPHIQFAAEQHLRTWLGHDFYTLLLDEIDTPTLVLLPVYEHLRSALGFLALYEYSHTGGIQLSESGFLRVENDNYKGAYKYQENNYRRWMLYTGYEKIEELLFFLEANLNSYPDWELNGGLAKVRSLFINSARRFREVYGQQINRYTFESLRPLMADIEKFALPRIMGQAQYDDLKSAILAATTAPDYLKLIRIIQPAIASFAVEEGTRRNLVQLSARGVVQIESLEPQSSRKEGTASTTALSVSLRHNDEWGNRHIHFISDYLETNRASYPLYDAWRSEEEPEATPTTETVNQCRYCSHYSSVCHCRDTSSNQAVVHL